MAKKKHQYYAVHKGRTVGVFESWPSCQQSVNGFKGAIYKGFGTRTEAEIYSRTGEVLNPTKFYGIAKGHIPGVYTSWAKAAEQIAGFELPRFRGYESIEAAKTYVADLKGVDASEVPVFRSHFERFHDSIFKPDHSLPFVDQFDLLASSQNWSRGTQEWHKRRTEAIESEFEFHFLGPLLGLEPDHVGSNDTDDRRLKCYQRLCAELRKEKPQSIPEARTILKAKPWVNIIDLIDSARMKKPFETWNDFEEFREYTSSSKKWIDLKKAKENEFLSALLVDFRKSPPSLTGNRVWNGVGQDREGSVYEDYKDYGVDDTSDVKEEQGDLDEDRDAYNEDYGDDEKDNEDGGHGGHVGHGGHGRHGEDEDEDEDDDYFETLQPMSKRIRLK